MKRNIVRVETIPYLSLFDINKEWLDLKIKRTELWDSIREQRREMYNITIKLNETEKKTAGVIIKLGKKIP